MPSHTCRKELSQRFSSHFTAKIGRATLQAGPSDDNFLVMSSVDSAFVNLTICPSKLTFCKIVYINKENQMTENGTPWNSIVELYVHVMDVKYRIEHVIFYLPHSILTAYLP